MKQNKHNLHAKLEIHDKIREKMHNEVLTFEEERK